MANSMERPQVYVRQLVDEAVEAKFAEMGQKSTRACDCSSGRYATPEEIEEWKEVDAGMAELDVAAYTVGSGGIVWTAEITLTNESTFRGEGVNQRKAMLSAISQAKAATP